MFTRQQQLVLQASEAFIDASNRFCDLHDSIHHLIKSPFDPAFEIAEVYMHQLRPLFTLLAEDFGLDITVKTTFRLRKPKRVYLPTFAQNK